MKQPIPLDSWPDSWKLSYQFDREEVFGEISNRGYAYAYQVRHNKTLEMVSSVLPPSSRILDLAAGQGNFTLKLAERGYDVTWNDLRDDLAGYVKQKHEFGNITYRAGNAFTLDFPVLFDGVLITEVIEHVAHPDEFLAMTARLVKRGGYIIMTTPNGQYLRNTLPRFSDCPDPSVFENMQFQPDADGHIFLLWEDEVRTFALNAGLDVVAFSYFTNPLTNGHLKTSVILDRTPNSLIQRIESLTQKLPRVLRKRLLLQVGVVFYRPL
jgi:2-polyprenyl-3-methyl-5-hydroxy-6-metoxy-1,4-benzoquinol methylase